MATIAAVLTILNLSRTAQMRESPERPVVDAEQCFLGAPDPRQSHVQQSEGDEPDCVPASAASLLRQFGLLSVEEDALVQVRLIHKLTRDQALMGVSRKGIRHALKYYGVHAAPWNAISPEVARDIANCSAGVIQFRQIAGRAVGHASAFYKEAGVYWWSNPTDPTPRSSADPAALWVGVHKGVVVVNPGVTDPECLRHVCDLAGGRDCGNMYDEHLPAAH